MGERLQRVTYRFVDYIPATREEGVIYIAPEYGAVVHSCLDGCGEKVSTPLSPAQWQLQFDGETISLSPSIGNWGVSCQSHYIIRRNKVIWAGRWSDKAVADGGTADRLAVEQRYAQTGAPDHTRQRWWRRVTNRLTRR